MREQLRGTFPEDVKVQVAVENIKSSSTTIRDTDGRVERSYVDSILDEVLLKVVSNNNEFNVNGVMDEILSTKSCVFLRILS